MKSFILNLLSKFVCGSLHDHQRTRQTAKAESKRDGEQGPPQLPQNQGTPAKGTTSPSVLEQVAGSEDLLTEILLRLPVKSLLRFETVSKRWLSLITNPNFSLTYTRRRNPKAEPPALLLNHRFGPKNFRFLPLNEFGAQVSDVKLWYPNDPSVTILNLKRKGTGILQACNGLIICWTSASTWRQFEELVFYNYYICNPFTRRFAMIHFPSVEFMRSVVAVNLAFDPLRSPFYKLVCFRDVKRKARTYRIDVYSSETRAWKPPLCGDPLIFIASRGFGFNEPVYCKGAIHWVAQGKTTLYFDVDTERMITMPMPAQMFCDGGKRRLNYFGESRGHLHIVLMDRLLVTAFDVLEMESDYSGWFVRYHVDLERVMFALPGILWTNDLGSYLYTILGVVCAQKEEESTVVVFVSGTALSINLNDNYEAKKLCDLGTRWGVAGFELAYECGAAHPYFETLFRV